MAMLDSVAKTTLFRVIGDGGIESAQPSPDVHVFGHRQIPKVPKARSGCLQAGSSSQAQLQRSQYKLAKLCLSIVRRLSVV